MFAFDFVKSQIEDRDIKAVLNITRALFFQPRIQENAALITHFVGSEVNRLQRVLFLFNSHYQLLQALICDLIIGKLQSGQSRLAVGPDVLAYALDALVENKII